MFTDPYQYYGRLSDEMLRAMRLVVDTGLHTRNWTREQSIKYMLSNSSMAPSDADAEVERYFAIPGQALGSYEPLYQMAKTTSVDSAPKRCITLGPWKSATA